MNRLKYFATLCFSLLLLVSLPAHAAGMHRSGVVVTCSCSDETGQAYAAALRNALSRSNQYREVSFNEGVDSNAIRISIVSMPVESTDGKPPRAALSIVCLHDGAILHQFIETCVRIPIHECAEQMLTHLLEWESSNS